MNLEELLSKLPSYQEKSTLKKYGRFAENPNVAMMLRKNMVPESRSGIKYATPEYGAMLQGEDFDIPEQSDAQHIPFQAVLQAHPTLSAQEAVNLSGAYVYPEKASEFGSPIEYLKGHELSHLVDQIAKLRFDPNSAYSKGIGNMGYVPTKRTRNMDIGTTPSQIENWLLNYKPKERNQERKAHLKGLEALWLKNTASH